MAEDLGAWGEAWVDVTPLCVFTPYGVPALRPFA